MLLLLTIFPKRCTSIQTSLSANEQVLVCSSLNLFATGCPADQVDPKRPHLALNEPLKEPVHDLRVVDCLCAAHQEHLLEVDVLLEALKSRL